MFAIIVNPVSGGGKNAQIAKQIEALLTQRGETYQVFETANEGDGDRQVRMALESGCDNVVCIGGDGTLSEIVHELAGSGAVL
ncbi:MAG: acylglycerol kinase family protein, partial [Candidatus Ventricola sp.]|nr:acylglycerol kinase family protein [Candidatus Ventricola sp.]